MARALQFENETGMLGIKIQIQGYIRQTSHAQSDASPHRIESHGYTGSKATNEHAHPPFR